MDRSPRRAVAWTLFVLAAAAMPCAAPADEATDKKIQDLQAQVAELKATITQMKEQTISKDETVKLLEKWQADASRRGATIPQWVENLRFFGDFRLRYATEMRDYGTTSTGSDDFKDRNRARFRLRFGFVKTWMDDQMEVGFRLASGNNSDPTTTDQSLGESSSGEPGFAKRPIWIDLAWAKYSPKALPGFSITGGKMINPMMFDDVFFDQDVNPEGFWADYQVPGLGKFKPFVGAGYFIVKETNQGTATTDSYDVDMWAVQAGLAYEFSPDLKYTLVGIYNGYSSYGDSLNAANGNDTPLSKISNFRVVDVSNRVDFTLFGVPANVFWSWAYNCANSDPTVNYDHQSDAYCIGMTIGQNKKKGDWSLKYRYAYIQANALPGQYCDSNFGYANRKGHWWGGAYNISNDLTANLAIYYTSPVHAPSTANTATTSAYEGDTTTILADLVWNF